MLRGVSIRRAGVVHSRLLDFVRFWVFILGVVRRIPTLFFLILYVNGHTVNVVHRSGGLLNMPGYSWELGVLHSHVRWNA